MAPSERKEPGLGAPNSGSGSDGNDDDFLNLIPDRLAHRGDRAEPAMEAEPRVRRPAASAEEGYDDPEPAVGPLARLSPRGPEPEEDEDDYDDEPEGRSGSSRGVMAAVVVGAVVAGIGAWWWFLPGQPEQPAAQTPVIAAADEPYKVRPADPGGMQVPNTDKMVYDRLGQNTGQEGGSENLLAQPPAPAAPPPPAEPVAEQPASVQQPLPEQDVAVAPTPQPVPTAPAPAVDPAPAVPTAPVEAAPAPAPAQVATPAPKPAPAPQPQVAAAPPAPAPAAAVPAPAAPAVAGGGNQMVQLAALKDEASARAAWQQAVASNKDLLGNLSLDIQRADLGAKGVFYRVRAKGLRSADEAKALCDKLAARKVGCIVVR